MSSAETKKLTANIKAQGCAAKLSPAELAQIVKPLQQFQSENLICGTENFEDAAVYKLTDETALISTIDFFPPIVDDPYLYGRIAAVNALSDVYAMGGKAILALNVFCFPTCDYPLSLAAEILAGGADAVKEADCLLVGGHSIQAPEPVYGLSVTGLVDPRKILKNSGAKPGDQILLCKPIGSGVALLARKGGVLSESANKELMSSLCRLNGPCLEIAKKYQLHAATDITGFGLIGHLHEMAKGSGLKAVLNSSKVPLFSQVLEFASQGIVPAATYANRQAYGSISSFAEEIDLAITDLLFDPQSSGGLLFALAEGHCESLCHELTESGWTAARIGEFQSVGDSEELPGPGFVEVIK